MQTRKSQRNGSGSAATATKGSRRHRLLLGLLVIFSLILAGTAGYYAYAKYEAYHEQQTAIDSLSDQADSIMEAAKSQDQGTKSSIDVQNQKLKAVAAIIIPEISVKLPVYNNSSQNALDRGAGWLPQSSPIGGGATTHAVVDAHSGKIATLFSNLPKLTKGNAIYLKTAKDKMLEYKVISKHVYDPTHVTDLKPQQGKDLLTLITCYPIYQNTSRMHVTAIRVPYDHKDKQVSTGLPNQLLAVIVGTVILIVVGLSALIVHLRGKRKADDWVVIQHDGRRIQ